MNEDQGMKMMHACMQVVLGWWRHSVLIHEWCEHQEEKLWLWRWIEITDGGNQQFIIYNLSFINEYNLQFTIYNL